jgi:predicted small lipoprotein YifL
LYGAARIGDFNVTNTRRPTASGWTILVVAASALLLAACGRKGPLDLPPTSSAPPERQLSAAPTDTPADAAAKPTLFNPNYGTDAAPAATRGKKTPFLLDPLLDSK